MHPSTKDPLDAAARTAPASHSDRRAHRGATTAALATVGVVAALALTACGGSSKPKAAGTPPTTTAGSSPATSTASSATDAATIKSVYEKFIDLSIPVDQKLGLIQDGTEFKDAMDAEAKNPQAKNIGLQVTDVKVTSASLADVTFTILSAGSPLLANQHGFAVKEGGTWKVSGATFCGLLAAQAPTAIPPVCSKPAATSLPTG